MRNSYRSIRIGGRRIVALESAWCPKGRWMIVWDSNGAPYLRKVVCILPKCLEVMFPVYAVGETGVSAHCCWLHAGEIPEGLDVSGLPGYGTMMDDLEKGDLNA